MADLNVTNTKFTKVFEEPVVLNEEASDESVVDTSQIFIIDPEETANKTLLVIENADTDPVAVKILANVNMRSFAKDNEFDAVEGKTVIQVSSARHLIDGTIKVELTPASGKALLTDHAVKVSFVKLA